MIGAFFCLWNPHFRNYLTCTQIYTFFFQSFSHFRRLQHFVFFALIYLHYVLDLSRHTVQWIFCESSKQVVKDFIIRFYSYGFTDPFGEGIRDQSLGFRRFDKDGVYEFVEFYFIFGLVLEGRQWLINGLLFFFVLIIFIHHDLIYLYEAYTKEVKLKMSKCRMEHHHYCLGLFSCSWDNALFNKFSNLFFLMTFLAFSVYR